MKSPLPPIAGIAVLVISLSSCATEEELRERRKPPEPKTGTTKIPWNVPQPGQGGGQMGMMLNNQNRR